MRTMYDSVSAEAIPTDAELIAAYIDGAYENYQWCVTNRPNARVLSIAVFANDDADILDVESGDATPDQAPGWLMRQRAAGRPQATIYTNSSTWPQVQAAMSGANIASVPYWIAQYDHDPTIPPEWVAAGCVAKQYESTDVPDLDTSSVISDAWYPTGADDGEAVLCLSL